MIESEKCCSSLAHDILLAVENGHRASPQHKQGEPSENSMLCLERGKRIPCLRCGLARKRIKYPGQSITHYFRRGAT